MCKSLLFSLAAEKGVKRNSLHCHHLEPDSRNITLGLALATEARHKHFIVFRHKVEAAITGYEGSDFLAIFLEHHTHSLTHGRVRLLRLDTYFFDDQSLGHAATHEGVFEARAEQPGVVLLIIPPA